MEESQLQAIASRIDKLLELSRRAGTEAEAENAAAKVQDILLRYNLDLMEVEKANKKTDKTREDTKLKGGLYKWQRDLWGECSRLNFCMHWSIRGLKKGSAYEHRVLGSKVNVMGTRLLAEYLQEAIERIARDFYQNNPSLYFSKAAIAFREGMTARITQRLSEKRWEEKDKARQQRENAADSTALTVLDVEDAEYHANRDHLNGWEPGTSARRAAEDKLQSQKWHEEWVEKERIKKEQEEAFKHDFPEEWAAQEKLRKMKEEADAKKWRSRAFRGKSWEPRHQDYNIGYVKGDEVSLNRQVDSTDRKKLS